MSPKTGEEGATHWPGRAPVDKFGAATRPKDSEPWPKYSELSGKDSKPWQKDSEASMTTVNGD
tara:strand:- start:99 stop:287 length:189 start_codon:yes stop_codon:yes gene_type:complete